MNNGLRSDYLKNLVSLCIPDFNDVVPCDKLLDLKEGDKYICNLDPSNEKGSHYVAISIKENYCLYFDSFGFPCMNEYIQKALLNNDIMIVYYSKKRIQDGLSLFCGYFCLAFLICDQWGLSLKEIASQFLEKDLKKNEEIATNIIKMCITK